jgi:ferredoxin
MKITVLRAKCQGHRNCAAVAPDVFDIDEEFKAVVLDPKGDSDEAVLKAAKICPTCAILLEDEKTGERIFPKLSP